MSNKEIPVFFTVDDGYVPFLSVALSSMINNSNIENNYKAIIIHQELSDENKKRLRSLAKEHFKVEFAPMKDSLEEITDRMSNRIRCDYFTLTIYFRLFIAKMFPMYDKGIYIDSDVVVNSDIAELFRVDIGENLLGGCSDLSVANVPVFTEYMEKAVGVKSEEYINSGVLLLNMKALREEEFDAHFLRLLTTYHFDSIAPDQDYINAICNGRIFYLDATWNTMPREDIPEDEGAKLVHYNLFTKPWCYEGLHYEKLFWDYAKYSGYYEDLRAYKDGFDEEKLKYDAVCLERLLSRGASIPEDEITFRKIAEKGEKIRL